MAQQEKTKEIEVREEIEDEDELDGWGPVRARRSTIPSAPPGHGGLCASDEKPDDVPAQSQNKGLMT